MEYIPTPQQQQQQQQQQKQAKYFPFILRYEFLIIWIHHYINIYSRQLSCRYCYMDALRGR